MAADYLPLIAWTPDAGDLEMIEAYVARSYYARPDARVRFHDLTIRRAAPSRDAKEEEFAWFHPVDQKTPPLEDSTRPYFALYAVPADEAELGTHRAHRAQPAQPRKAGSRGLGRGADRTPGHQGPLGLLLLVELGFSAAADVGRPGQDRRRVC